MPLELLGLHTSSPAQSACRLADWQPISIEMVKVARNGSTERFSVATNGKHLSATIRESESGRVLDLKGYGALSGQFAVRKGIDLSKPIAAQAAKGKSGKAKVNARKPG